jgi:hypothetical protein
MAAEDDAMAETAGDDESTVVVRCWPIASSDVIDEARDDVDTRSAAESL